MMSFFNTYHDNERAESYAELKFPGTYYLAYRDLPQIYLDYASGHDALDFGCGAGRSTRFLKKHGFNTSGIDISEKMITLARQADKTGNYRLIKNGSLAEDIKEHFDLITAIFTFDNIPDVNNRVSILKELKTLLKKNGCIILLDSTPEIYYHEWASFSTADFPENRSASSGDIVKIIQTDVEDRRPVEDVIWFDEDYQFLFSQAELKPVYTHRPLASHLEPFDWINETKIPPWVIYVLK